MSRNHTFKVNPRVEVDLGEQESTVDGDIDDSINSSQSIGDRFQHLIAPKNPNAKDCNTDPEGDTDSLRFSRAKPLIGMSYEPSQNDMAS